MKISASWLYQRAMLCAVLISLSLTSSAQEDYADTTETGSKSYVDVNFESLLDSISALELETGEEINRFLEEAVPGRLYMRHDYAALMNSLAWLVGELFDCGTDVVTFDGHDYSTVEIGSQCWFAENLRSENYANGDAIPSGLDAGTWASTTDGAVTVYGEGTSTVVIGSSDEAANLTDYGRLYNWHAVSDIRNVCPTGWHVPTDAEWTALTDGLGGATVAGGKVKTTGTMYWQNPNTGASNSSGFSGLPGGLRYSNGNFNHQATSAFFWSSSSSVLHPWLRLLYYGNNDFEARNNNNTSQNGFSVRCLRD